MLSQLSKAAPLAHAGLIAVLSDYHIMLSAVLSPAAN
jgi:hypothetical protein